MTSIGRTVETLSTWTSCQILDWPCIYSLKDRSSRYIINFWEQNLILALPANTDFLVHYSCLGAVILSTAALFIIMNEKGIEKFPGNEQTLYVTGWFSARFNRGIDQSASISLLLKFLYAYLMLVRAVGSFSVIHKQTLAMAIVQVALVLPVWRSQTQSKPSCEPLPAIVGVAWSMKQLVIGPQCPCKVNSGLSSPLVNT